MGQDVEPEKDPHGGSTDIGVPRNEVAIEIVGLNKWFGTFHAAAHRAIEIEKLE